MSPFHGMREAAAGWLESRGLVKGWVPADGTGPLKYQTDTMAATPSSDPMIIDQLEFAAAKSLRTSIIILASFNSIAAFATAAAILFEGYSRGKRNHRTYKFSREGFRFIPSCDVFPLVLSFGIMIQAIVFAVAQSTGLSSLFGLGCTEISQVVLPTIFLVPYIQLVFGVEMFLRGLRPAPFAPRGKRSVAICLVILGLGVLANFLVAAFDPAADLCLTYLFWFAAHWSWGCFALLTAIASILLICCIGIFLQLTRSTKIEVTERVAASRMVYYLAVAIISNAFMIPFFFMLAFGDYIAARKPKSQYWKA
ncbi:hypothetical protein P8C59_000317 [Phyllachora maydis]|uniref:Uncharacterized protein n=1 Tax=Phyllachora maydis TaxID=1825666 RepID=A0AAD9HX02_9PEZI|nr:hypothetical protein P8C59_000317 [Phyllachora maydis]